MPSKTVQPLSLCRRLPNLHPSKTSFSPPNESSLLDGPKSLSHAAATTLGMGPDISCRHQVLHPRGSVEPRLPLGGGSVSRSLDHTPMLCRARPEAAPHLSSGFPLILGWRWELPKKGTLEGFGTKCCLPASFLELSLVRLPFQATWMLSPWGARCVLSRIQLLLLAEQAVVQKA